MVTKSKEDQGGEHVVVEDDVLNRMAVAYGGPERRRDDQIRKIVAKEVVALLVAILTQVKEHSSLQPRPLSDKAKAAIAAYDNNRRALGRERP
jgi:hypothetical protein